jgi:hypothetical protein
VPLRIGDTEVEQQSTYRGSVFPVNLPPHSFCFVGASDITIWRVSKKKLCVYVLALHLFIVSSHHQRRVYILRMYISNSLSCCSIALNAYAITFTQSARNERIFHNSLCAGGIFTFPLLSPGLAAQFNLSQPQLTTIVLACALYPSFTHSH